MLTVHIDAMDPKTIEAREISVAVIGADYKLVELGGILAFAPTLTMSKVILTTE